MLASRVLRFRTSLPSLSSAATSKSRRVLKAIYAAEREEGMGATVRRSLGTIQQHHDDPFLLLDEFWVGSRGGFPDHPHRGFETVTYLFKGQMQHEDFAGHKGTIGPGDLQWMTAGKGVVHCEMPVSAVVARSHGQSAGATGAGTGAGAGVNTSTSSPIVKPSQDPESTHGLQLWVNLSQNDKRCDPAYQDLRDDQIPRAHPQDGVVVKVIAGEAHGVKSKVYTRTPTMYLDYRMQRNQIVEQAVPEDYSGLVYMLSGKAYFGSGDGREGGAISATTDNDEVKDKDQDKSGKNEPIDLSKNHAVINTTPSIPFKGLPHQALILSRDDGTTHLRIETKNDEEAHFVVLLGKPLKEPIVMDRLFIMNSKEETQQAYLDYRERRNGFEKAKEWKSTIAPKGYRLKF
ncbi:hypothetical protein BGX24_005521 [Mortierella sp. AD032]|nr:hypothetical protein BGX24_005521 [Mortierella sp. AD032]